MASRLIPFKKARDALTATSKTRKTQMRLSKTDLLSSSMIVAPLAYELRPDYEEDEGTTTDTESTATFNRDLDIQDTAQDSYAVLSSPSSPSWVDPTVDVTPGLGPKHAKPQPTERYRIAFPDTICPERWTQNRRQAEMTTGLFGYGPFELQPNNDDTHNDQTASYSMDPETDVLLRQLLGNDNNNAFNTVPENEPDSQMINKIRQVLRGDLLGMTKESRTMVMISNDMIREVIWTVRAVEEQTKRKQSKQRSEISDQEVRRQRM